MMHCHLRPPFAAVVLGCNYEPIKHQATHSTNKQVLIGDGTTVNLSSALSTFVLHFRYAAPFGKLNT